MNRVFPALTVLLVLAASGCAKKVNIEAERAAVRDADMEWSKAASAKDLERTLAYFADEATMFPPNASRVSGKQAIRAFLSESFTNPDFAVSWQVDQVEVSGELAYSLGSNEFRMKDSKGKPVRDRGKYVTVWKKQPDGSWRAVIDIWNSNLSLAPAAAPVPTRAKVEAPSAKRVRVARFAVQLGAYEERAGAEALAQRLATRYQPKAGVAAAKVGGKTLYRVRIPVQTEAEGRKLAARIESEQKIKALVVPLP